MKSLSQYEPKHDRLRDDCPVKAAIDVVRGRWKPSILFELKSGRKRFCDLQCALNGVTAQALTVQLRELEFAGVIERSVYPETPPRVEYALTQHGKNLSDVMEALEVWGIAHQEREMARRQAEEQP